MTEVLRVINNKVLVSVIEEDDITKGGIIIANVSKEKPTKGKVVAVGPGIRTATGQLIPNSVENGSTVLFSKNTGIGVKFNEQKYLVLEESEILAVITENGA